MAIDRLIGILTVLLREKQVTTASLAERFEVSARTIARDIERLSESGIPVRTTRGFGGGVSIMEGYGLERTLLTNADRGAILAGLRSLDSVSGTGYYRQLMEKLPPAEGGVGDDCVTIDLASWYGPLLAPRLEELKTACAARRVVSFTYCAPSGETRREVEPGRLLFRWSSWYLWAWCRTRRDFRLFKLNRMLDFSVTDEGFPARAVPPVPPLHLTFPEELEAAVRFAPSAKWKLVDEYGAESFQEQPDGALLFRRSFPGKEELLRWVLTFGDQAEILEPVELRRDMAEFAQKIWEKYDSQLSSFPVYNGGRSKKEEISMVESRCGIRCSVCTYRESTGCAGCTEIAKPFWGDACPVKSCCEGNHLAHCGACPDFPCDLLKSFAYDPQQEGSGARLVQCQAWREEEECHPV